MDLTQYNYKTELHTHSNPVSPCSLVPVEELLKYYADLGYNSVVLSNHFFKQTAHIEDKEKCIEYFLSDYKKAKELENTYGINVILGCELRFNHNYNDYLLFGIDEDTLYDAYDYMGERLESFSEFFRQEGRLIIQAHPFRDHMEPVDPKLLDGIEAFNMHPNHNSRIGISSVYAKENNLIVTAGTDFHVEGHQGLCAILTKEELKTSHDVARVLLSRDYVFEIGGSIVLPYGVN